MFNDFEQSRYERQMQLPELGLEGQKLLSQSSVAISRAGGVGGTVASLLARAGIGGLYLVHPGMVEADYLNRWPLAFSDELHQNSSQTFKKHLERINPAVEVSVLDASMEQKHASSFVQQADVYADASPLFSERYAFNQLAVTHQKPMVSGGMYGLEGYVFSILPQKSACFACLYPKQPEYWTDRKVFPVIAPSPSMVGSMMAMEIIKLITGMPGVLYNKMWFFDMMQTRFSILDTKRSENCQVCGKLDKEVSNG